MVLLVYKSEHATITSAWVKILDYEYLINEIDEISLYEGRESMVDAVGYFGDLTKILASAILPSNFDSGLVVAKLNGKSDIIQGLQIAEAKQIIEAFRQLFAMQRPLRDPK